MYEAYDLTKALPALGGRWQQRTARLIEHTGVPLSLSVYDHDGLKLTLEYDASLYEAASVDELLDQLDAFLSEMVRAPDQLISQLVGMSDAASERVVAMASGPALEASDACTAHGLIWEQADRCPDAIAVSSADGGASLSYAELRRRALGFAAALRGAGCRPSDRVGLCVGRVVELAVGVLGILEIGAAYVPLDPTYPRERLQLIIEDAGIEVVATTADLADEVGEFGARAVIITEATQDDGAIPR